MRVGILISGRGSNMVAIARAATEPASAYEIGLVLSNRPHAAGLARAKDMCLKTVAIDHADYSSREDFDTAIAEILSENRIDLICLAGFMRILTEGFIDKWWGRMLNIHPSLLPSFRGLKVHEQVLEAGVRISGCTVHFVTPDLDTGPIIGQAAVPVVPNDTSQTLADRVANAEHILYPACLEAVAEGRVRMEGRRAVWQKASEAIGFWRGG